MSFEAPPTKYGITFTFANDSTRSSTSAEGEDTDGTYFWMDTRQMSVDNPNADKILKVTLVKLTSKGMDDVYVSEGAVPEAKLAAIYQAVNVK